MRSSTCLASRAEQRRSLPADFIVAEPMGVMTNAITIDAPPDRVWPWLVQLGAGRAGWYSYDRIDNGGVPSAGRIVPEYQHVAPGDVLPATPGATDAFVVASLTAARPGPHRAGSPRRQPSELGISSRAVRSRSHAADRARTCLAPNARPIRRRAGGPRSTLYRARLRRPSEDSAAGHAPGRWPRPPHHAGPPSARDQTTR